MRKLASVCVVMLGVLIGLPGCGSDAGHSASVDSGYVVLGYSELGMHCMNQDFSELAILPPFNNLRAQVIKQGPGPHGPMIVDSGVVVLYSVPGNTHSADKTNFWDYASTLFGVALAPEVGLTGNGLSGVMVPTGMNDWGATGIPLTPQTDGGTVDPFQLAEVTVQVDGAPVAQARPVIPVSWEIRCDLCHNTPGISTALDILQAHDRNYATDLENAQPVLCGSCHAQAPLGTTGAPGVPSLSSSMHLSHASRMSAITLQPACYACHPGIVTQCLRDVHHMIGMDCNSCHVSMEAVGDASRSPWVDLPRCMDCHSRANFMFEEEGKLYRESRSHHGIYCAACHGSPHAVAPSTVAADNVQAMEFQGHAGTIDQCSRCHINLPESSLFHHHLE
jgi:hypothetical protein